MAKARSVESLPEDRTVGNPEPFRSRVGDRVRRRLGDAFGLTQFGVNLTTIGPGAQSALRHWHTLEDELLYVVDGEVVLVTDAGEQLMTAGDVVAFPAGVRDAHHLINRSAKPVRYLEVGARIDEDVAHFPDDDLAWQVDADGKETLAHKDGTPY